ncbi:MAG: hypothetical protein AAFO04_18600 [Cyanobacteria bacterium J06592_8]
MTDPQTIQFTFGIDDPQADEERVQKDTLKLLKELRELDEVIKADRTEDLDPEIGSKPGFATIWGVLTTEVSIESIKGFLGFLGGKLEKWGNEPIKMVIKVGDQEIHVEAKTRKDILAVEPMIENLLTTMQQGEKDKDA